MGVQTKTAVCYKCKGVKPFKKENITRFKKGRAFVCDDCLHPDPRLKTLNK